MCDLENPCITIFIRRFLSLKLNKSFQTRANEMYSKINKIAKLSNFKETTKWKILHQLQNLKKFKQIIITKAIDKLQPKYR